MKFISFIASTMLIVLISQHSIIGLPVNVTIVEKSCSEGFELMNGQCIPMYPMTNTTEVETSSVYFEEIIVHEEIPVIELNIPKKSGVCPEGMKHGKHGICHEIESADTTEVTVELTTDYNETVGRVENTKGCPEGTELDEQGDCQEIKPSKPTPTIIDPKRLLKKDGSCPDNYKMIEGRCLYIKPKTNSTLYPSGSTSDNHFSSVIRPKSGTNASSKVELVPVLADNSCPEGTEYSEYGLCQKHTHLSNTNFRMKPDAFCPGDLELINGKCSRKNSTIEVQLGFTTTTTSGTFESTTLAEDAITNDRLFESTTIGESDYTSQSETTSSPL